MILINEIHLVSIEVILFISLKTFIMKIMNKQFIKRTTLCCNTIYIDNVSQYLMKQYVYQS